MCRLAAYIGPPVPLRSVIVDPAHSLLDQSMKATEAKLAVNGDGFGFAWYDQDTEPGLYRDVLPAWSDGNLLGLCRMIRSRLFLAHVRASTSGETSRVNCHPFTYRNWSFMHNGQVPDIDAIRRPLETLLPDALYAHRRGTTDSELIFLLLLTFGLMTDPAAAFQTLLDTLRAHSAYGTGARAVRLTCVLSDGAQIYGFRHSSDRHPPTLYVRKNPQGGWLVASEPLDPNVKTWTSIEPDVLITLSHQATHRAAITR